MKHLATGVFQAMRKIDLSKRHHLSLDDWNKIHVKTRRWLTDREMVRLFPGTVILSIRGELLLESAITVNFWAGGQP